MIQKHQRRNVVFLLFICLVLASCALASPTQAILKQTSPNQLSLEQKSVWAQSDSWFEDQSFATTRKKSYQDFLDALRTFESSIDPKMASEYAQKYNDPTAISYQKVSRPGRVIRGDDGAPLMETTSYKDYFIKLGIDNLYTRGSTDPKMFRRMQYSVTNFLGFIGYQFSEADLWVLGYYSNYDLYGNEKYYSDLPDKTWAHGVRSVLTKDGPLDARITDVNTWSGTFSGKHGISSLKDFKDPTKQDFIAKDHFVYKYRMIVQELAAVDKKLSDYLGTTVYWNQLDPPVTPPPGGRSNAVTVSMSGLLAGAHLRGAKGVVDLLVYHKNDHDEIGTYDLQYVQDYGGYSTPFLEEFLEETVYQRAD